MRPSSFPLVYRLIPNQYLTPDFSPEADLTQLTTSAQKIRSSKNIPGLKAVGF
jgi:hypothetical protein